MFLPVARNSYSRVPPHSYSHAEVSLRSLRKCAFLDVSWAYLKEEPVRHRFSICLAICSHSACSSLANTSPNWLVALDYPSTSPSPKQAQSSRVSAEPEMEIIAT